MNPSSVNVLVQQAATRANLRAGFVTYVHLREASDPRETLDRDGRFGGSIYNEVMVGLVDGEEWVRRVNARPGRTPDDVSITWDGRRLDSKESVVAFLEEVEAARREGRHLGPE